MPTDTDLAGARERGGPGHADPALLEDALVRKRLRAMPEGEHPALPIRRRLRIALAIVVVLGAGAAIWALATLTGPLGAAFGAVVLTLYLLVGGLPAWLATALREREEHRIAEEIRKERERAELEPLRDPATGGGEFNR